MIDEIMFIEKGGCGSSHGGAQAALPINIDISRRLVQKIVRLGILRRARVLTSFSEQSVHFCFNDDFTLWLVQIEFGVLVLKMTNNTGFYGSCCDVRL